MRPTIEQFVELFDLNKKTFYNYKLLTVGMTQEHWIIIMIMNSLEMIGWKFIKTDGSFFHQMWWEDDTLLMKI